MTDTNKAQFVTVPAGVMRAALGATSGDSYRPILGAVQLAGEVHAGELHVTVAACDSYRLFVGEYCLKDDFFNIDGSSFEWLVKPTNKLGTAQAVRVECTGEGRGAFEVTTYKGRSTLTPIARAAAKLDPAAWHRWDEPEGNYPNWKQLMPEGELKAAAGWAASPAYVADAYKALRDATGEDSVTFDGMDAKDGAKVAGPLLYSAHGDGVTARYLVMPQRDAGTLVVGGTTKGGEPMVTKTAYDEMSTLYRRHALRRAELEKQVEELTAEVERLKESTAAADEHMYSAEHVQHVADEYQAVIDRQHDELMEAHDRINALEAEVANAGKVIQLAPRGATVEDDGVFLTIDAANAHGFIVRSKDGSPLLLATQNDTNIWLTGDTKALRERIESLTDGLSWSAKRKAWWASKASKASKTA